MEHERAREAHVGAIGIADTPVRLPAVEAAINGNTITETVVHAAGAAAFDSVDPPDDIHAPGDYRRALLQVLTERALSSAAKLPRKESA
jgi:carbon-monoxide dehydrogenase medium subunit